MNEVNADVRSAISSETWTAEELVATLPPAPLQPFARASIDLCAALSRELMGMEDVRKYPQIVALAYWLRPASIQRASDSFLRMQDERTILVPRGLAFHVTPANVDTMFLYSWILSLLAGNINVVHISDRTTAVTQLLLGAVGRLLAHPDGEALRQRNRLVHLGHTDAASRALSAIADLRVVWGGDDTVEHFRRFPLKPRGREISFPDRHSFAVFSAQAVESADDEEISAVATAFYNDAYWFDQAACASPRLIIWDRTEVADDARAARDRFKNALQATIRERAYRVEAGMAIEKTVFAFRALAEGRASHYRRDSNELLWLEIDHLASYRREHCAGGLFYEHVSGDPEADLIGFVTDRDQTCVCYGLAQERVRKLAERLNGRGVDRWVSVGRALEFSSVWDGFDLLQELTKRTTIDVRLRTTATEP